MSKTKPVTIEEYLSGLDKEKRAALEKLRKVIKSAAPRAEECISYQMPAFRIDGKVLLWFGAGANHCAFYPGGIVERFKSELKAYKTSKGTIQFRPDKPISAAVVRKIVRYRIVGNAKRRSRKED